MAYYKPCKNCAVDKASCPRRQEVATAIAGHYITVINFRCNLRKPLFHQGQRVRLTWTSWDNDGEGDEGYSIGLTYHGTVVEEIGLRFIVRLDEGPSACAEKIDARDVFKSDTLVIKVKPSDMAALDEPDRALCPSCSAYEGEKSRCHGWEDQGYGYFPNGCFNVSRRVEG